MIGQVTATDTVIARLVTEVVPALILLVIGRMWGEVRATRKAFHAAKFSEEEGKAYEAAHASLVGLANDAAHCRKQQELSEQRQESGLPAPPEPEETSEGGRPRGAAEDALAYIRQVVLLGPVALSEPAVKVLRDYVNWYDDPRSDTDTYWYEYDFETKRSLRDFVARRRVDLGQTGAISWYGKKWYREARARLQAWWTYLRSPRAKWADPKKTPEIIRDTVTRGVHASRLDVAFNQALSIGIASLAVALVLLLWQAYHYARAGTWYGISVTRPLGWLGLQWAYQPADWFGVHRFLTMLPAVLGIGIVGLVTAWTWYSVKRWALSRRYGRK